MGEIDKVIFTFARGSAHLRGVLFMHEDVHGRGGGRMSRTAIVTPKICACTLVLMMVVLTVGDVLQGRACEEYNGPRFLGVQAGRPG